jgi:hypothetical protein
VAVGSAGRAGIEFYLPARTRPADSIRWSTRALVTNQVGCG